MKDDPDFTIKEPEIEWVSYGVSPNYILVLAVTIAGAALVAGFLAFGGVV